MFLRIKNRKITRITSAVITVIFVLIIHSKIHDNNIVKLSNLDEDRAKKLEEMQKNAVIEKGEIDNKGVADRIVTINRAETLKNFDDLDKGIAVLGKVNNMCELIPTVSEIPYDLNIKKYYSVNEDVILKVFGITKEEEFIQFATTLKGIQGIKGYTVIENEIMNNGNECELSIVLEGTNRRVKLNIKAIYTAKNHDADIYITKAEGV